MLTELRTLRLLLSTLPRTSSYCAEYDKAVFSRRIYLQYLLTAQCSVFRPPVLGARLNLDVSV